MFDTVVKHGGFASAEASLNISSSTISNHMANLESRLGVRLCNRGRGGFFLTDEGSRVYEASKALFKARRDFESELGALRGHLIGSIKIAVADATVDDPNNKLPVALRTFNKAAPNVTVSLYLERSEVMQEQVLSGAYHCGIGNFPHLSSSLIRNKLYRERHLLYAGSGHVLFGRPDAEITEDMIIRQPIVGRHYWGPTEQKRFRVGPPKAFTDHVEPIVSFLLSGVYIGFLPEHFAGSWVERGLLRPLCPEKYCFLCDFDLITKRGPTRSQVLQKFCSHIVEAYNDEDGS
ncbi:LysR family transcriptional regulator [Aquamicrobium soli]|uniref:LysR family transcriptional regulator n=1 Tax=Aquamicrobium soli TaxID=1811518 RepID=A0ABV7K678_9HYPH